MIYKIKVYRSWNQKTGTGSRTIGLIFSYNKKKLGPIENVYTKESGISLGVMRHLDKENQDELRIEIICNEALKTSEIEGKFLDRGSLQSSICKEFGVGEKYLHGNIKPEEAGIAMMMKDLHTNFNSPLSNETLCAWHDKLFNGRTDLKRGKYRTSKDDMQIVSGRIDKLKIHFVTPPASKIPEELLTRFCASRGETKGTKEFTQVLLLHKKYDAEDIHIAIKKALRAKVSCIDAVQALINSSEEPADSFGSLPNWEILPTPDISVYSQIGGTV